MSLLTNTSSLQALQSLRQTSADLQTTQSRISSGLRVANASDNAAYFAISTTLRSDNGALSSVKDALNIGASTIDVATSALSAQTDVLNQIKQKLLAAQEPGVDRTKVQTELSQLTKQLKSISDSASFSGQNFLSVDSGAAAYNATTKIVASFSRDTTGAVSVGTIDIDSSKTKLYDAKGATAAYKTAALALANTAATDQLAYEAAAATAAQTGLAADITAAATAKTAAGTSAAALAAGTTSQGIFDKTRIGSGTALDGGIAALDISGLTSSAADNQKLADYSKIVDSVLTDLTAAQSSLGSSKTRISLQQSFVANLSDSLTRGVGSLVDADLNQESTRLQALQVQQQLGVQSLSIANQQNQQILKLFG